MRILILQTLPRRTSTSQKVVGSVPNAKTTTSREEEPASDAKRSSQTMIQKESLNTWDK